MISTFPNIEALVSKIVDAVHPLEIVLFGSRARAEMSDDSDIDLMVVMPDGTHQREVSRFLYRQIADIDFPIDIIVATPAILQKHKDNIGLVYYYVLKEGKSLYVRT
jgi:predicted nucleotidyltransferase